jgi:hypothetical protein
MAGMTTHLFHPGLAILAVVTMMEAMEATLVTKEMTPTPPVASMVETMEMVAKEVAVEMTRTPLVASMVEMTEMVTTVGMVKMVAMGVSRHEQY